ncbi:cytochrome c [Methylomonas sp. AM2-LC]|uniref:c-type cytochrome n=1 Tax=Methylomonas sp. AM2-LC TaxID=3153301 RepID=UPI0032651D21
MKYKTSFSCLFAGILAFGYAGMASAETDNETDTSTTTTTQAQTLSFSPGSADIVVGGTLLVKATSTSGLNVVLSQDASTTKYCSFNQKTGFVTGLAIGNCKINATQKGNSSYAFAKAVLVIPVNLKLTQTINFGSAPKIVLGGSGVVTARASSGLPVVLTTKTPAICSVSGNTVKDLKAGLCTIAADQAGNTHYASAPEVTQSFNISQHVAGGGNGNEGGDGGNNSGGGNGNTAGGTKLPVTAPFNCSTLASSGNAADDGRRAYMRLNCVSCHGQDASGGMGPDIRDGGGDVAEAVNGEGAMPSFAGFLCPNDVVDLEAYLGSLSKTQKHLDWDVQFEKIVDGSTAAKPSNVVPGP